MAKANQKFEKTNKSERPKISREENELRRKEIKAKNYNNSKKMI